jgi:hypothetical protein
MGIFRNPLQGIERFVRHPIDEITHPFGHSNKLQHFKRNVGDLGILGAETALAIETGGGSLALETGGTFAANMGRQWAKDAVKTTTIDLGVRSAKYGVRKAKRTAGKVGSRLAKKLPSDFRGYSKKIQENSARSGANRRKAQIPADAKRIYESRYFEVYRDSKGEKYLWGKPTLGPKSFRKAPASFVREWGENLLRLNPRYRKSDPLYKDMAKVKAKYGKMDHISGYSRGGAAALYQPASKSKSSRIFGPYVPYRGIGDHRARRSKKFDPVHVGARAVTKFSRPYRLAKYRF